MKTYTLADMAIQAKDPSRASIAPVSRLPGVLTALRLLTEPGDTDVVGSGLMERCDALPVLPGTLDAVTYGEGDHLSAAVSTWIPDDFQIGTWEPSVLFDFHGTGDALAANFHVNLSPARPGTLRFQGFGGDDPWHPQEYAADIGPVWRNRWYDFHYDFLWSSTSAGWARAWVNDQLALDYAGPTLFKGQRTYMKLAHYHRPVRAAASSVIHDRVMIGASVDEVRLVVPRVVPLVPGASVSPAFGLTSAGKRTETVVALVPIGTPCEGKVLFTYRGLSYRRVGAIYTSDFWGSKPTLNAAVATA